jgi:hypothetical protein
MKYAEPRPYADPEEAARRIVEIASTIEPVQDGRIHFEKINGPFPVKNNASARNMARVCSAIERGWLMMQCTRAAPLSGSRHQVRSCSHEVGATRAPASHVSMGRFACLQLRRGRHALP